MANAETILRAGVPSTAAREAYIAAFHAALGILFERHGARPKTHRGLRARFAALSKSDEALDPSMGSFLARAYETKDIHDYDSPRRVTAEEARELLSKTADFIARIERALERPAGD